MYRECGLDTAVFVDGCFHVHFVRDGHYAFHGEAIEHRAAQQWVQPGRGLDVEQIREDCFRTEEGIILCSLVYSDN